MSVTCRNLSAVDDTHGCSKFSLVKQKQSPGWCQLSGRATDRAKNRSSLAKPRCVKTTRRTVQPRAHHNVTDTHPHTIQYATSSSSDAFQ